MLGSIALVSIIIAILVFGAREQKYRERYEVKICPRCNGEMSDHWHYPNARTCNDCFYLKVDE